MLTDSELVTKPETKKKKTGHFSCDGPVQRQTPPPYRLSARHLEIVVARRPDEQTNPQSGRLGSGSP